MRFMAANFFVLRVLGYIDSIGHSRWRETSERRRTAWLQQRSRSTPVARCHAWAAMKRVGSLVDTGSP